MREIKFRAWDGDAKKMLDPVDLSAPLSTYKWLGKLDVAIEQFTGLLDKNGKEIYEGDIVKKVSKCDGVHWYDLDYIKAVEISTQGVEPCGEYDSDCAEHEIGEFWEVIGNIHENPELLDDLNA